MTLWLCTTCSRAGTADDRVCCDRALIVSARGDEIEWYRMRLGMKSGDVLYDIGMLRRSPRSCISIIARHVERRGGEFVRG